MLSGSQKRTRPMLNQTSIRLSDRRDCRQLGSAGSGSKYRMLQKAEYIEICQVHALRLTRSPALPPVAHRLSAGTRLQRPPAADHAATARHVRPTDLLSRIRLMRRRGGERRPRLQCHMSPRYAVTRHAVVSVRKSR